LSRDDSVCWQAISEKVRAMAIIAARVLLFMLPSITVIKICTPLSRVS